MNRLVDNWITSFDNKLEMMILLTTFNRLVVNKVSQATQTHRLLDNESVARCQQTRRNLRAFFGVHISTNLYRFSPSRSVDINGVTT